MNNTIQSVLPSSISPPTSVSSPPPSSSTSSGNPESSTYYREWIIECIDKLRDRKARPDADRIAVLMKRQHNIPHAETVRCLGKLADMGHVIGVDYKGNISYRNPRKWRKCGSSCVLNPPTLSNIILETVLGLDSQKRIINPDPNGDFSFTTSEIEAGLRGKLSLFGHRLDVILDRECAYGCLARRGENRFVIDEDRDKKRALLPSRKTPLQGPKTPNSHKHSQVRGNASKNGKELVNVFPQGPNLHAAPPPSMVIPAMGVFTNNPTLPRTFLLPAPPMQSTEIQHMHANVNKVSTPRRPRLTIQPKRATYSTPTGDYGKIAKLDLDGNDQLLSQGYKSLGGSSTNQGSSEVRCSECADSSTTDKKIYSCSTCGIRAHLGCLGFWVSEPMEPATWQCPKCIVCRICCKRDVADRLLVCATCTRAYHALCHKPNVDENIEIFQPWVCEPCDTQGFYFIPPGQQDISSFDEASPTNPTGCDAGEIGSVFEDRKIESEEPPNLPPFDEIDVATTGVLKGSPAGESRFDSTSLSISARPTAASGQQLRQCSLSPRSHQSTSNGSKKSSSTPNEIDIHESVVASWSVQEVVNWLDSNGFVRESRLFLEQEIDGSSLLLVRQIELLTQLGLKLGPAVKILQLLKKIKVDTDEAT